MAINLEKLGVEIGRELQRFHRNLAMPSYKSVACHLHFTYSGDDGLKITVDVSRDYENHVKAASFEDAMKELYRRSNFNDNQEGKQKVQDDRMTVSLTALPAPTDEPS